MNRLAERPPLWLRAVSISGFGVTLLYTILSVFPIIDVPSWKVLAAKILAVLVGANVIGAAIYFVAQQKKNH